MGTWDLSVGVFSRAAIGPLGHREQPEDREQPEVGALPVGGGAHVQLPSGGETLADTRQRRDDIYEALVKIENAIICWDRLIDLEHRTEPKENLYKNKK